MVKECETENFSRKYDGVCYNQIVKYAAADLKAVAGTDRRLRDTYEPSDTYGTAYVHAGGRPGLSAENAEIRSGEFSGASVIEKGGKRDGVHP